MSQPLKWNNNSKISKLSLPNSHKNKNLAKLQPSINSVECDENGVIRIQYKNKLAKLNKRNSYQIFFGAIREDSKSKLKLYNKMYKA